METSFAVFGGKFGNAAHAVDDDNAGEAGVVAERVGSITHYKSWEMIGFSETIGIGDFGRLLNFKNIAGGAAESHGGETGN